MSQRSLHISSDADDGGESVSSLAPRNSHPHRSSDSVSTNIDGVDSDVDMTAGREQGLSAHAMPNVTSTAPDVFLPSSAAATSATGNLSASHIPISPTPTTISTSASPEMSRSHGPDLQRFHRASMRELNAAPVDMTAASSPVDLNIPALYNLLEAPCGGNPRTYA